MPALARRGISAPRVAAHRSDLGPVQGVLVDEGDRLHDGWMAVTEHEGTVPHHVIDVLVPIDVPFAGPFCLDDVRPKRGPDASKMGRSMRRKQTPRTGVSFRGLSMGVEIGLC